MAAELSGQFDRVSRQASPTVRPGVCAQFSNHDMTSGVWPQLRGRPLLPFARDLRPFVSRHKSLRNLLNNISNAVLRFPIWVIIAKFGSVANPPDVITATGFALVRPSYRPADRVFSGLHGLNDRAIRKSSATYVVNRAAAWIEKELPKSGNEIAGMEIVANLLALVARPPYRVN